MTNMKNPVLTVLRLGRARLKNIGWTQGVMVEYRKNRYGDPSVNLPPLAYCSLGAVQTDDENLTWEAADVLRGILGTSLVQFNDAPTTTRDDVIALFDKAIDKAIERASQ